MNILSYLKTRTTTLFDALLSPPYCQYCLVFMAERDIFCVSCYALIRPVPSTQIALGTCGLSITVHAVCRYAEPIKSLILAKAYSNYLASCQLAQLIWRLTPVKHIDFDYLVPIPLHWTREIRRGYNQAAVMAQELSRLSGKPVISALTRVKRTAFQSRFSQKDREKNVHNAFKLVGQPELFQNKTLLLVDDLLTTGATLKNGAKLFLSTKPRKIIAVVGARV